MSERFATIFVKGMAVWPRGPWQLLVREVSVMPDRTGSAVIAAPAPSLAGSSPVTDTLSAVDWPVAGAAVAGTAVSDADAVAVADDWPADDWPMSDGPA